MRDRLKVLYYPIKGSEKGRSKRFVRCSLDYDIGGYNYLTGENRERGYVAYIMPVTIGDGVESYVPLSGNRQMLVPCKRRSAKKYAEALKIFDEKHKELVLLLYSRSPDKENIDFDNI
jgi:hypothetical protein